MVWLGFFEKNVFLRTTGVRAKPSKRISTFSVAKGLREIIIWMLALEDCDVVTASGWEWSNPHPPNIDNP